MAVLNLSYGSQFFLRVVRVTYNDATHVVTGGSVDSSPAIPSGLGAGAEIWRTDGVNEYWSVRVQNTSPYAYVQHVVVDPGLPCDLSIDSVDVVPAMNGANGTVTIHASGSGTKRYVLDSGAGQVSNVFNSVLPGPHVARVLRTEDSCTDFKNIIVPAIPDLQVITTSTNSTAFAADDGTITVTINQGSGDYTADFVTEGVSIDTDGATPITRVALAPDTYTIIITDNVTGQTQHFQITLTEPAKPVVRGTIFDVPTLNSIRYVVENSDIEQGLDNRLLCNQLYGNYQQEQYFQKYNVGDKPVTQFISNYSIHSHELRRYSDDSTVTSFPVVKKEDNLNKLITYAITLADGGLGQTKVYFDTAEFPIPIAVNDVFQITDNIDFDGTYAVVNVGFDEDNNAQFFTITKAFGAPGSTLANGIFTNDAAFDVLESVVDLTLVAEGQYYLFLVAKTDDGKTISATSEPIEVKTRHEDVLLIVFNNYDNAFGVTWTTGYVGFIRVEGLFGHKRPTNGERTTSREADYSLLKISARKIRALLVEIFAIPPYLHEKLSVVFDCDVFSINNVPCQSSEGLQSENLEKSILVNSLINVEQLNWFSKYNSTDTMSTVSETSDCACDEIDLVPVGTTIPTVTLDFAGKRQRIFKLQPDISANRAISLANNSLALSFRLKFKITQDFIDATQYFQFPNNFQSNGQPLWNPANQRFSPVDPGLYEAEATYDGTNWQITFESFTYS